MRRPRDKFYKNQKAINLLVKIDNLLPKSINKRMLVFFRGTTGMMGAGIRYILVRNLAKSCGSNVVILEDVFFVAIHMMSFGNNVSINPYCYVAGEISFGNDVSVANHTSIHSTNHTFNDKKLPIKEQPVINNPIEIADNVWIGSGCRILSGVKIGTRVVVAAGAVVNKSVPSNSMIAGVPAKVIKII
jgi:acetyltransferase-like isoleucine patch superfamily enzyme